MATRIVPIDEWGQDHWSTLAYLEACVVDKDGFLHPERMRTSSKYPTRLKEGVEESHNDWDCVADMIEAGLVCIVRYGFVNLESIPFPKNQYTLTEKGWEIVKELRKHRASKESWSTFHFTESGHAMKHYYHYSATVFLEDGSFEWNSGKVEMNSLVDSEEAYDQLRSALCEVFGTERVCLIAYQHICSKEKE